MFALPDSQLDLAFNSNNSGGRGLPAEDENASHFRSNVTFSINNNNNGSGNVFPAASFTSTNNSRLDREYLWEGDEMMYEDIVASTQPLYYNPTFLRKFDYEGPHNAFQPFVPGFNDDDSVIEE